jgi:DNA-binding MarR family transcriptional regulator
VLDSLPLQDVVISVKVVARKRGDLENLNKLYARKLIDLELIQVNGEVFNSDHDPEEKALREYCMSTTNRRTFAILCVRASLDDIGLLPSDAVKELGATRQTVDTMITEMSDAGYIIVRRMENNHRLIFASDGLTAAYTKYAAALADISQALDLAGVNTARKYAK